jgi:predicted transcriptional regulator
MERDMDLCREILAAIEDAPFANYFERIEVDGYTQQQIYYHIWLLYNAGLIDAFDSSSMDGPRWNARKMTMAGHEFLEIARNDTNWKKAKDIIVSKGQTLSIEALKVVLPVVLRHALGL